MSRVALVTGGSRGIGAAIAVELGGRGHQVAVNYSKSAAEAEVVAKAVVDAGGDAITVPADVGDAAAVADLFAAVESELGPVEILVNNAGVLRDNLLLRMDASDWEEAIRVNLTAVFYCTKAALRSMVRARWGRVIAITSVAGLAGNPGQSNYAAAKAGIVGFTKSVAKEVGSRGITVNAVAPGFIATAMTEHLGERFGEAAAATALGRLGEPGEVASAVGYLASDEASYITGQVIQVDGGLVL